MTVDKSANFNTGIDIQKQIFLSDARKFYYETLIQFEVVLYNLVFIWAVKLSNLRFSYLSLQIQVYLSS